MQHNQYFTSAATFQQLVRRLQEYAQVYPLRACKGIRFSIAGPQEVWDATPLRAWSATAYCYSRWQTDEPLFELGVQESRTSCRVRMRCVDPGIQDWFDTLLDWLAPDWTTTEPQPLPAAPLLPATAPAAAAPALPVSPEPSPPPKRRRGPKPGKTPAEMEAICVEWLAKAQFVDEMWVFCDKHRITEYRLKTALRAREKRIK